MRRAVVGVLTGALLLAAIIVVHRATPGVDTRYRPIASVGEMGEQVNTTSFELRADRVELAGSIKLTDDFGFTGETRTTAGIWVVVWTTVSATTDQLSIEGARLRTAGGAEYLASSLTHTLDKSDLQPGIPQYGPLLFEIPRDRLAGAALAVTTHRTAGLDLLGPAVDVDLGLSGAYAAELLRRKPASLTVGPVREL